MVSGLGSIMSRPRSSIRAATNQGCCLSLVRATVRATISCTGPGNYSIGTFKIGSIRLL